MTPLFLQTESDVFGDARGVFESELWAVLRNLTLFFCVVFWLASAYWVYKDARRRIEDPLLLTLAVALGVFPPFLGPLLYMLFRPPEYLEDVRERRLEIKEMEQSMDTEPRCPFCRASIEPLFLVCPVCTARLKEACGRCKSPLERLWRVCPYCESPVEAPRAVEKV